MDPLNVEFYNTPQIETQTLIKEEHAEEEISKSELESIIKNQDSKPDERNITLPDCTCLVETVNCKQFDHSFIRLKQEPQDDFSIIHTLSNINSKEINISYGIPVISKREMESIIIKQDSKQDATTITHMKDYNTNQTQVPLLIKQEPVDEEISMGQLEQINLKQEVLNEESSPDQLEQINIRHHCQQDETKITLPDCMCLVEGENCDQCNHLVTRVKEEPQDDFSNIYAMGNINSREIDINYGIPIVKQENSHDQSNCDSDQIDIRVGYMDNVEQEISKNNQLNYDDSSNIDHYMGHKDKVYVDFNESIDISYGYCDFKQETTQKHVSSGSENSHFSKSTSKELSRDFGDHENFSQVGHMESGNSRTSAHGYNLRIGTTIVQYTEVADAELPRILGRATELVLTDRGLLPKLPKSKKFKCTKCGRNFSNSSLLLKHIRTHLNVLNENFKKLCNPKVGVLHIPSSPVNEVLNTSSNTLKLGEVTSQNTPLQQQERRATPFPCSECEHSFSHNSHLVRHKLIHVKKVEPEPAVKTFVCPLCGITFPDLVALALHKIIHKGESFKCDMCVITFSSKEALLLHGQVHTGVTGEKRYNCSKCEVSYTNKKLLKRHVKNHRVVDGYLCSHCGKGFALRKYMQKHELRFHDEKSFKCSHCDAAFGKNERLQNHVRTCHTSRVHKCPKCEKVFKSKVQLKVHERVCHAVNLYKCSTCNFEFQRYSHLQEHIQVIHGYYSFKCTECNATFKRRNDLRNHAKIHQLTQSKTFKCTQCDESFPEIIALALHELVH